MPHVLIISGSPVEKSKSSTLLEYAKRKLEKEGISTASFSIREFPAEDLVQAKYDSPSFNAFKEGIQNASAIIIGTPIYKASFTGGLKSLLDILPQNSLRNKIIVPVATGGTLAHLLAIDYSLKPVLAVLGATDLRQGMYVVDNQFRYTESGFEIDSELQERFDTSLHRLINTLREEVVAA